MQLLLPLVPTRSTPTARSAGGSGRRWSWRATTAATSGRSGSGRTCRRCGRSSRCCSAPAACSRRPRRRGAVHAVAAGLAQPAAGGSGRDRLGELLVLAVVPSLLLPLLSPAVGQTYGVGDALVHGVCLFIARRGVLQPGVPAVDGVQRRVAAAADCVLRAGSASRFSNGSFKTCCRSTHVPRHERRELFPRRRVAVARAARQRSCVGGNPLRRGGQHRAPGFLAGDCSGSTRRIRK